MVLQGQTTWISDPWVMPSPTLVGAALGLGVNLYSNAVRKVPLMRQPWEHLIAMGVGGYLGNAVVKLEESTAKDIEVLLQKRATENAKLKSGADT